MLGLKEGKREVTGPHTVSNLMFLTRESTVILVATKENYVFRILDFKNFFKELSLVLRRKIFRKQHIVRTTTAPLLFLLKIVSTAPRTNFV